MSLADYFIVAAILVLVVLAVRHMVRKKGGGCAGCSGCCGSCAHHTPDCAPKSVSPEEK